MKTIEENTRAVLAFYEEVLSMQESLKVQVRDHADILPQIGYCSFPSVYLIVQYGEKRVNSSSGNARKTVDG